MRVWLENACIHALLLGATVFLGRVALKLAVTTLVCVKLLINLWRFAPPEKSHCKKRPVYAKFHQSICTCYLWQCVSIDTGKYLCTHDGLNGTFTK